MMSSKRTQLAILAALAVGALPIKAAHAQQVGTAAAVNPAAQARGATGARTIVIGQSITHKERIQTTSAGSVQLLFLDKTSMTIGPNSDLAIDEYVYDPNSNTGKLAATLSKGVMRFVGGQISHAGNAEVSTPNAVVGIRGGVAIFQPNSVFVGYGEGSVRSGGGTVTLGAGEYTQTVGGAPPTNPGPPPENFLRTVLASLQSQAGQGGGSRATPAQVNAARTVATGSQNGNIANNVQAITQQVSTTNQTNAISQINQTVQTTTNQSRVETVAAEAGQNASLTAWTGGLVRSFLGSSQLGSTVMAIGVGTVQNDAGRNRGQANFVVVGASSTDHQDGFSFGNYQYGSLDPNLPSNRVSASGFEDLVGQVDILTPATTANGEPISTVNNQPLLQHDGLFLEIKPGTQLGRAAEASFGTKFCECEFTRWGLWDSDGRRNSNSGTIRDYGEFFWVAGQLPNMTDVPTTGTATYVGHAIANISAGQGNYSAAGAFRNVVDFGARTGQVSVSNLDGTNYAGQMFVNSGDPRSLAAALQGVNNPTRSMILTGNFFRGATSPVGEMGGALLINGANHYTGAGIFAGRMQ